MTKHWLNSLLPELEQYTTGFCRFDAPQSQRSRSTTTSGRNHGENHRAATRGVQSQGLKNRKSVIG
jgi:hypothetical protein